jgi:hypothetical protein
MEIECERLIAKRIKGLLNLGRVGIERLVGVDFITEFIDFLLVSFWEFYTTP